MIPSLDLQTPKETFEAQDKKLRAELDTCATALFASLVAIIMGTGGLVFSAVNFVLNDQAPFRFIFVSMLVLVPLVLAVAYVTVSSSRALTKAHADYQRHLAKAGQDHLL